MNLPSVIIIGLGESMTLDEYAKLAEIIGVIVVITTLIYLSVQIRQGATQKETFVFQSKMRLLTSETNSTS